MKLVLESDVAQYHPTTGLILHPGEHDYPDDKTEDLLAAGLKKPKAKAAPKEKE